MRGATECAKRLKLFFSTLRSKMGKVSQPAVSDPITQMILGILSRDTPESKASEGLDRLRAMVVDYNELRVIPPIELAEVLHDFPDARLKCEDIARALNRVFALEHAVSLASVEALPKKETGAFLEKLDGLEPYTVARIRLLGLRQHAIPLDEAMWAVARREEIVSPRCTLAEAQAFLERQIEPADALEFVALLKKHAWSEMGAAVRKGEVERIQSVPPDRSSRNMLQAVSLSIAEDVLDADEAGADEEAVAAPVKTAARRRGNSAPARAKRVRTPGAQGKKAPAAGKRPTPVRKASRPKSGGARGSATKRSKPARKSARKSKSA